MRRKVEEMMERAVGRTDQARRPAETTCLVAAAVCVGLSLAVFWNDAAGRSGTDLFGLGLSFDVFALVLQGMLCAMLWTVVGVRRTLDRRALRRVVDRTASTEMVS